MPIADAAPACWPTFVRLCRQFAPDVPGDHPSQLQRDLAAANRNSSLLFAGLSALRVNVPDTVTATVTGATQTDASGAVNSAAGELAGRGLKHLVSAEAGLFSGGIIMLLQGAYQSLDRTDQMNTYLLGILGYLTTLSRACVEAVDSRTNYTTLPQPPIPHYIRSNAHLITGSREQLYLDGYRRARRLMQAMDEVRPVNANEWHYSKSCLVHIAIASGTTGGSNMTAGTTRRKCEEIIEGDILQTDISVVRERLRRWANAA